jgi:hypothetical protein
MEFKMYILANTEVIIKAQLARLFQNLLFQNLLRFKHIHAA